MTRAYLPLKELSQYSGLSVSKLRELVKDEAFPATRLNRKILVKVTDFDHWARVKKAEREHVHPTAKKIVDDLVQLLGAA